MKKGRFINILVTMLAFPLAAQADVILSPSYYKGRKLELDLGKMPIMQLCEDDTAISTWPVDKNEFHNEFLSLKKGICLFHRGSLNKASSTQASDQTSVNNRAIQHLETAIQKGLPIAHQNYANLLSGILHCRQAKISWPLYKKDLSFAMKSQFCAQRKSAIENMGDVDFAALMISFTNKKDFNPASFATVPSLGAYTDEMGSCKNTRFAPDIAPLSPNGSMKGELDTLCSTERVPMEEASAIVNEVLTTKIVDRYIKGSTAPVTAMLQRKKDRASGVLTNSRDEVESLQANAKITNKKYYCLNNQIYGKENEWGTHCFDLKLNFPDKVEIKDSIKARADKVVEGYKTAVGNYAMVSDTITEYQNNLLTSTSEHPNPIEEIKAEKDKISNKMEDYKTMFDIFNSKLEEAINTKSTWKEGRKQQLAKLCRVYYCEVLSEKNKDFRRQICEMDLGSGQRYRDTNPLCDGANAQLKVDNVAYSVKDLCKSVSGSLFHESYYVENRRGTDTGADACWVDATVNAETAEPAAPGNNEAETFLSYYTDLLRWKKIYVLVVKDGAGKMNPYKMEGCTKEQALRVAQIKELPNPDQGQTVIRDDYYFWDFVTNGLYTNPYISCRPNDIDQSIVPTTEPVVFTSQGGLLTYYLKSPASNVHFSVDGACLGIKEALGLKYPIRRFYNGSAPQTEVKPISCGRDETEPTGMVADAGWKVYWVPPEDGWYIPSTEAGSQINDDCSKEAKKAPQNHVGALILSHNDTIFLPIVKANSCFLNNVAIYDHTTAEGIRTFPSRILSVRRFFGIPDELIAQPLPQELRTRVDSFPFFEFCQTCSQEQALQRFAAKMDAQGVNQLVNIETSSNTEKISYLSGETAYTFTYRKPGATVDSALIFNSCNKKVLEALQLTYSPFERARTSKWYEDLEADRRRKFTSQEFPNTFPCFPRRSCTFVASSPEDIRKAVQEDVCNLISAGESKPDYIEIQLQNDIVVNEPLVFDGKTPIGDTEFDLNSLPQVRIVSGKADGSKAKITFRLKDSVMDGGQVNVGFWINDYWKQTRWVASYKSRYTSIPAIAFFSVKEAVLENLEFDIEGDNDGILVQNRQQDADFVGIFAHNTRMIAKNILIHKAFEKALIARNRSEVYVSSSTLQATRTVVNVQNSRLALYSTGIVNETESSQQLFPRKGIHLTRNSEMFIYGSDSQQGSGTGQNRDNSIKAQVPIVIKGNNIDELISGVAKRNMQAKIYESALAPYETNPNSVVKSECLWLRWGPQIYVEQTQFKCDVGVFFKEGPFLNDVDKVNGADYYTAQDAMGYPASEMSSSQVRYFETQFEAKASEPSSANARFKPVGSP